MTDHNICFRAGACILAAALAGTCFTSTVLAQSPPPKGEIGLEPDEFGYNTVTGSVLNPEVTLSLGALEYRWKLDNSNSIPSFSDNFALLAKPQSDNSTNNQNSWYEGGVKLCTMSITAGSGASEYSFPCDAGSPAYTPIRKDGSTLTGAYQSGSRYVLTHTDRVGGVTLFEWTSAVQGVFQPGFGNPVAAVSYVKPDGEKLDFFRGTGTWAVRSTRGWVISYEFGPAPNFALKRVKLINASVEYCEISPSVNSCSQATSNQWPSLGFVFNDGNGNVANPALVTREAGAGGVASQYSYGTAANDQLTVSRGGVADYSHGRAISVGNENFTTASSSYVFSNGNTWAYASQFFPISINAWNGPRDQFGIEIQRTDPNGKIRAYRSNSTLGQLLEFTDENGGKFRQKYDSGNRLEYLSGPEATIGADGIPSAGYTRYSYDTRGNLLQTLIVPKSGSGLASISTSGGFAATCSNARTCNKPLWLRDARGAQTDFTYAPEHGGTLSEMGPPPVAGAARPLKLTTWTQRYAWTKIAGGALVQATTPVWVVASETQCQTAAGSSTPTCDSTAVQTVTTYEYGANGSGESLLVKGLAVTSGGTTLRSCYRYDIYMRRIAETRPSGNPGVCA